MAIASITKWLEGRRDYRTGVELYIEFGESDFLKNMLSSSETTFNRSKLLEVLQQLNASQNVITTADRPKFFPARWIDDAKYAGLPEAVKQLMAKKELLFKEARDLHSQLELLNEKSVKECGKAAFNILDLWDQIDSAWEKLDYFEQHGKLPEEKQALKKLEEMSREELQQRKFTVRTYITKGFGRYREEMAVIEKLLG